MPGLGVELAGGLVGDEQGGVVGEGAGDGDPLLLAAGEFAGPLGRVVGEADEGQQQLDALLAFAGVRAAQPQRDADVLGGAEDGDEAEGLEDEADVVAAQGEQALLVEAGEVAAVDVDPSPVGGVQAADDVEQGGLARSRAPLEGDEFAAGISKETPRSACTAAAPVPYDLCTSSTRTMASVTVRPMCMSPVNRAPVSLSGARPINRLRRDCRRG